jgi:hypothetical protein
MALIIRERRRERVAETASKKTVDDFVAGLEGWQAEIVMALRALVREAAPEAREVLKWAQPVWERNGPFAYAKPFPRYVNFGFWRGASLSAPEGLLQSGGSKMAHVKLASARDVQPEILRELVKQAVSLNLTNGDPTKGP